MVRSRAPSGVRGWFVRGCFDRPIDSILRQPHAAAPRGGRGGSVARVDAGDAGDGGDGGGAWSQDVEVDRQIGMERGCAQVDKG